MKVNLENGTSLMQKSNFTTTNLGPRVMKVNGAYNVRDVGGYESSLGGTTKQGLLYRGGQLNALTKTGKAYMKEEMGIKTEIDLRGYTEESGYVEKSSIEGATLKYILTDGYVSAFRLTENFRQVFSEMAIESNYPMYVHCTGGADRTGTVMFLLNALLGVSETDLVHDYEFTTFSTYGMRSTQSGTYAEPHFQPFLAQLKAYEGTTLAEKTENYMLSIGVTQEEIQSIRTIFLGD